MFDDYLARWNLTPDGKPITTHSSHLLPVRRDGVPAMLKIALEPEERRGATIMVWWGGEGAARVLAHERDALLMERIPGGDVLLEWVASGRDAEATRILCAVAARLHAPRNRPLPTTLVPLARWFAELQPAASRYGGILCQAAVTARDLLADPRDVVLLHGDIHHRNVLNGGDRGWLAIDPKGLVGERGFDFANLFHNPDDAVATAPGRVARQADVIAEAAGIPRSRVLRWALAYSGLSATWNMRIGRDAGPPLRVAELVAAELANP